MDNHQVSEGLAHLSGLVEGLAESVKDNTKVTRDALKAHDTRLRECEKKPSRAEIWLTTGGVGGLFTALIAFVSHLRGG